jgi:Ras-related protein Rab-10
MTYRSISLLINLCFLASYYRGATGIMLVYDVTQARSFENINKWLRNIDDHASDDVVKMLIGNKCDMDDKRCIARMRGEALAREHTIPFLETSAKNNVNVEKAFFEMARLILKKTPTINANSTSGGTIDVAQGNGQSTQSNCMNCM